MFTSSDLRLRWNTNSTAFPALEICFTNVGRKDVVLAGSPSCFAGTIQLLSSRNSRCSFELMTRDVNNVVMNGSFIAPRTRLAQGEGVAWVIPLSGLVDAMSYRESTNWMKKWRGGEIVEIQCTLDTSCKTIRSHALALQSYIGQRD